MKDLFISSYKNKKNEEKFSIGVSKEYLFSLYSLDKNAYEEFFDEISEHLENQNLNISDDKVNEFTNFLKLYFSF